MNTTGLDTTVMKRNAIAFWNSGPLNRPIKITSADRAPMLWAEGYVTSRKFVAGRTLIEAERILGLPLGALATGAFVTELLRLPTVDEFDLRGYSQCPDGRNWTPASAYPAGAGAPQWQIRRDACIPSRVLAQVAPGGRVPA